MSPDQNPVQNIQANIFWKKSGNFSFSKGSLKQSQKAIP